jgi:glycosyltransferase involved in cell wall biosynthesis
VRVALVVHKFPPESLGGTEIYTWSLARALASAGHDVHVYHSLAGSASVDARVEREGLHLWRVLLPQARSTEGPIGQYWHTFRAAAVEKDFECFLKEVSPEIIHFHHVQGVSARLIELARGLPRIVTLHDYWFFCFNSQLVRPDQQVCSGPRLGWNCVDCATVRPDLRKYRSLRPLIALPLAYRNFYLRKTVEQVDLLVAPSHFVRQQYILQGWPGERIVTISNGLDRERLAEAPGIPMAPPPARPHFGFIGSIGWHKGVHVLVDAFNQLSPDAALTIYGDDQLFPDYTAKVRALVRHPHVRFAGRLDLQSVGGVLRQLDCLVVPSVCCESFSMVIQEAFAMGVPVVASRIGALPEKVTDGLTGRLFEPGDGGDLARVLRELIAQPEQLVAFKKNLQPGPSIQEHSQQMAQIYVSLAQGTPIAQIIAMVGDPSLLDVADAGAEQIRGEGV